MDRKTHVTNVMYVAKVLLKLDHMNIHTGEKPYNCKYLTINEVMWAIVMIISNEKTYFKTHYSEGF